MSKKSIKTEAQVAPIIVTEAAAENGYQTRKQMEETLSSAKAAVAKIQDTLEIKTSALRASQANNERLGKEVAKQLKAKQSLSKQVKMVEAGFLKEQQVTKDLSNACEALDKANKDKQLKINELNIRNEILVNAVDDLQHTVVSRDITITLAKSRVDTFADLPFFQRLSWAWKRENIRAFLK